MKPIPLDKDVCPECNGDGYGVYSCCSGERLGGMWQDYMICPQCREHLGEEDCPCCEGKGWIEPEISDEDKLNYLLYEQTRRNSIEDQSAERTV